MKVCKSEHRMRTVTEAFIAVETAEQAVDRLTELHDRATKALSQALKRYLKDRVEPDAAERALFRYPELRLVYECHGEVPLTTRAYAKVQLPGTYSVTVTHPSAFRKYLLEQLVPLMNDFTVKVHVGVSEQNIPYPYVVEQGDELAGSGVTAAALARVFPSTDLSAATDGIADGLYDWENTDPLPLALFDAARVDFSLRRLVHYTGSDWRHVQPWILLTNYHRYVDQFILHGLEKLREDPRFVRMVLPGNVVVDKNMSDGEAQAIVAGVVWHRYQMPDHTGHDGLRFAVAHVLVDHDVAWQHHAHEARVFTEFFQAVEDELVNVTVVVGQQDPGLYMAPVATGVMHKPPQGKVHTCGVEQGQRQRIGIGPVVQAVSDTIGGGRQVGTREYTGQGRSGYAGTGQFIALLDHIGIRDVLLADAHVHLDGEVIHQRHELFKQVFAEGRGMGHGHAVGAG